MPGRDRVCSRRRALLLSVATVSVSTLGGCSFLDDLFVTDKTPLPGKRRAILTANRALQVDNPQDRAVVLPPPSANAGWPQAGGVPAHSNAHPAARDALAESWRAEIGEGGGYRAKITASPVVGGGRVFTMDSDAVVTAHDAAGGSRLWRLETQAEEDRSTNVGGGLALDGGRLFATTGRGDVLALDAATGHVAWRARTTAPARAAPTIAEGRLYIPLIDDELVALSAADGKRIWSYQATAVETAVLGLPAPAYADGLVVAGFGSGELVALRAATGAVAWTETLATTGGRTSLIDLSSITAMPVIDNGQVFATGLGGLTICLDLRSGRRLWEREIGSAEMPWLAGDWLFLLATSQDLAALNRNDGAVAWVTPLPQYGNQEKQRDPIRWLGPTLVSDRLVLAGSVDRAVAISPYTGKVLGRQDIPAAGAVAPVVAGGTVYMVTDDATLIALR